MKKFYLIVIGAFLSCISFGQPLSEVWTKLAGESFEWFITNNNVRSLDYNKVANKLLVSDMNNNVYVLNAETGEQEGTLSRTGLGVEGFKHIRIRCADDGAIYGVSLQLGAGTCIVYRWANVNANPTIATQFPTALRTGDAMGISGSGNSTIIYLSGAASLNNNAVIYMLRTPNGVQFILDSEIRVASGGQQWSNRTIEPVNNSLTSDIFIKTSSGPVRRIEVSAPDGSNVRTGTVAWTTPDDLPIGGFSALRYFKTTNNKEFLAFAASANATIGSSFQAARMRIYDITNPDDVKFYAIDSLYEDLEANTKANGNGTGDVAVKEEEDGQFTIFYLSTNNGIRAVLSGRELLPVTMGKFDAALFNNTARLDWTTVAENNNKGFNIEKSANGTDFSRIGFVSTLAIDGNSKLPLNYSFTDNNPGRGRVFYRLQQLDRDGKTTYSDVKWVQAEITAPLTAFLRGNPIASEFSISITSKEKSKVNIALVNASGAVLQSHERNLDAGETIVNLPASQLPKGLYFVTIREAQHPADPITLKAIK